MSEQSKTKKMSLIALILMIFTSVFGFNNIVRGFYNMGYFAIPWYILSGICVFLPYAFMMAEFGAAYKDEKGGIYTWMEKAMGPKFAFMGTFMWYISYVVWMVNVSQGLWVPFTTFLFGYDKTSEFAFMGFNDTQCIGILAVIFLALILVIGSKGLKYVSKLAALGGITVSLLNIVLLFGGIIMLIANGGPVHQITSSADIFSSPNPLYQTNLQVLAFVVYAIFAYGGIETIGGLVDQTENAEKNFPKGIGIAAIIITIGYSVGIFMVGAATNWTEVLSGDKANIANVAYVTLKNLGYQVSIIFGASESTALAVGSGLSRFTGLAMVCSLIGAFFTLSYAPLKQLIEGTPAKLWPEKFSKVEGGVPKFAMKVQCVIAIVLVLLISFGGDGVEKLFLDLVNMTNVSMTIPIIFLSLAFVGFKKNDNIKKNFVVFKNKSFGTFAAYMVATFVILGNIFTIINPAIDGDIRASIFMVIGPVAFGVIAMILYSSYERKYGKTSSEDEENPKEI